MQSIDFIAVTQSLSERVNYKYCPKCQTIQHFRCQVLISSPNTTMRRASLIPAETPSFKADLVRVSTTTCLDSYRSSVRTQEFGGFNCTELSQSGPGPKDKHQSPEKCAVHWDGFLGESVDFYQDFTAINCVGYRMKWPPHVHVQIITLLYIFPLSLIVSGHCQAMKEKMGSNWNQWKCYKHAKLLEQYKGFN